MEKTELLKLINNLIEDYNSNVEKVIKMYQLSIVKMVHVVNQLYRQCPTLIPTAYSIQKISFIDKDHKNILDNIGIEITAWELKYCANRLYSTHNDRDIPGNVWFHRVISYDIKNKRQYSSCIDAVINSQSKPPIATIPPPNVVKTSNDLFYRVFQSVIILPALIAVEDQIFHLLLQMIYKTIEPDVKAISYMLEKISDKLESLDIITLSE